MKLSQKLLSALLMAQCAVTFAKVIGTYIDGKPVSLK